MMKQFVCAKISAGSHLIEKGCGKWGLPRLGIEVCLIVFVVIVKSLLRDPYIISKVKRPSDRINLQEKSPDK